MLARVRCMHSIIMPLTSRSDWLFIVPVQQNRFQTLCKMNWSHKRQSPWIKEKTIQRQRRRQLHSDTNIFKQGKMSDQFGTLGDNYDTSKSLQDMDGESEFMAKISDTERPRPFDYLKQIEGLLRPPKVELKMALNIFDDMKKEYVKPTPEILRVLIHACGSKGYSDKAFELYSQYTARRFPVNYGIFADLFNSCANCPKSEEDNGIIQARALQHAKKLYSKISSQFNENLPPVVYHTMIKAFGRCGEIEVAYDLLDKMGTNRVGVNATTICHVLHACISDKSTGFRHALLLWRKMRQYKITPNVHCYNLLLRTVKECGTGNASFLQDILIEFMSPDDVRRLKRKLEETRFIENASTNSKSNLMVNVDIRSPISTEEKIDNNFGAATPIDDYNRNKSTFSDPDMTDVKLCAGISSIGNKQTKFPNFLAPKPDFFGNASIIGLSDNAMQTTQTKFSLFGNVCEFLNLMINVDKAVPDMKTLSQLLHCIEPNDEDMLIECIKKYKVKPDIDFFNQLIRKRVSRFDYSLARSTIEKIREFDLALDISTFGCLAMACTSDKLSYKLLNDMHVSGIRPNLQITTALLRNACHRCSFQHIEMLLSLYSSKGIKPDLLTIKTLECFYYKCRNFIVLVETQGVDGIDPKLKNQIFGKILIKDLYRNSPNWKKYVTAYRLWLEKTDIEFQSHPWKQFLTSTDLELGKNGPKGKQKYISDINNF